MTRLNTATLRKLAKSIQHKPLVAQQNIAARVAPIITQLAGQSYDSGQTVYGDARPSGVHGNRLSLMKTGKTRPTVFFKAVGTIVRAVLGTKWSKYLIGKYKILPIGNADMPFLWRLAIRRIANEELARHYAASTRRAA